MTKLVGRIDQNDPAESSFNIAYGSLCTQERRLGPRREKVILPLLSLLSGYLYGPGLDVLSFSRLISSRDKEAKKFEYLIDADMKETLIAERLPELPCIVDSLERLRLLNLELSALLRATAVRQLKADVALYKRERGVMSYEDMLNFVDRALRGNSPLVEALRKRYACAFVDEFQDTDSVQWRIFRNIFLCETNKLFIIGDPKQSIYAFRGADIDAYLEAKREMIADNGSKYYSLATNWRSSPPLIDAFNRLFGEGRWFPEEDISYAPVSEPPRDMRKAIIYRDGTKRAAITAVDINLRPRGESFHRAMAGFMASEIKRLLNMGAGGLLISKDGVPSPVTASDICILIKGRGRSRLIERFLKEAGIPHSFYKKAGLYNSEEALHISYILDAVEDPSREIAFKKALLTPFFAVLPSEVSSYDNLGPSHKLKILFERWYGYAKRRQWPVLFRSVIEDTGIYYDKDVTERRISNYRQILEGLEREAIVRNMDIVDIISTLNRYRRQESFDEETFDIERLETEEPRVRIMTIHAAKGLEFPVVFLADGFSDAPNTAPYWKYHGPDHKVVYDLMKTDEGKARLRREEVRDNRELFYVALTRAKYKLYIPKFFEEPYAKGPLAYIVGEAINNAWGGGLPDSRMLRFVDTRGVETVSDPPLAACEDRMKGVPKKATHRIKPVLTKPLFPDISVNFAGRKIDVESYSSIKEDMVQPGHRDDLREGSWITYYDESGYAKTGGDRTPEEDIHQDIAASPDGKGMFIPPGSSAGSMLHEILE
ncbi:MAG TPA: UvrD-helicase domain-containing protein, partial [Candidatus Omnitrophota bacterium]|nr:UvrD-helicase domain-containing protein [Candidatus Omnitrophota bacterium]